MVESGGIGIEYPSNPQIEANGGVAVCICIKPKSYSDLCQFKRRTGRIGRKGVVFFVFMDKLNAGSHDYMKFYDKLL